jgi:hypothetical protein
VANPKPLQLPGANYSEGEEGLFRRKLETQLLELEIRLDQAERRDGTVSSLASKRARYTGVGLGQSLYGVVEADGTVTSVATGAGLTGGPITSTGTISLAPSANDGNFIVGSGLDFVAESGATARASMGCGTGDGTVDTSGTPVDDDYAKFTDANTIEGRSYSEVRGDLYPESYLTAHRSLAVNAGRIFGAFTSGELWYADANCVTPALMTAWVKDQQDGTPEWDDSAVDGEFIYKGTDTRKFMITWNLNMWYYLRNNFTGMMGGIFHKPDGGAWSGTTPVAGSSQVSRFYFDYSFAIWPNTYWSYSTSLSGGAIVTVANEDTIRFQFGWKMYSGSNTGGLVVAYQSGGTNVDGMTINIVPVT